MASSGSSPASTERSSGGATTTWSGDERRAEQRWAGNGLEHSGGLGSDAAMDMGLAEQGRRGHGERTRGSSPAISSFPWSQALILALAVQNALVLSGSSNRSARDDRPSAPDFLRRGTWRPRTQLPTHLLLE
uniref:Uncharacterized protein n=1 Tax=Oryza punctata TaxID=4537 RepID=A0A0E0L8C8_ORYPU